MLKENHLNGRYLLAATVISGIFAIIGIFLTNYLDKSQKNEVEQQNIKTPVRDSIIPKEKSKTFHKESLSNSQKSEKTITLTIQDFNTEENLANVEFAIKNYVGKSNINGTILLKIKELNPKTEYDMFRITLKKDGYVSEVFDIGIIEDQTFKLKPNENIK